MLVKQVVNIAFPARISDLSAFFVESAGGEEEEVRPMSLRGLWSLQHALPKKTNTRTHTATNTWRDDERCVCVFCVFISLDVFTYAYGLR